MACSECLPTRLNPLAERTCFSQVACLTNADCLSFDLSEDSVPNQCRLHRGTLSGGGGANSGAANTRYYERADANPVIAACRYGCTDPGAANFEGAALEDDGSCEAPLSGCTDPAAVNYNPAANVDSGLCDYCPRPPGAVKSP